MTASSTTSTNPVALNVNSSSAAQSQQPQLPQQTLNQDDFLKLLVAQLGAQDPLNPVSDTEFIGQMAQFSTLQQTQAMQQNVAGLQASSLIGRTVQVKSDQGLIDTGTVNSVTFQSGTPSIMVNGSSYSLNQILSVTQSQPQP